MPAPADSRWHSSFWDYDHAWFNFFLDVALRAYLPERFPIKQVFGAGYVNAGHLFCAEQAWWIRPAEKK